MPFDLLPQHPLVPFRARQLILRTVLAIEVGPVERYGLPRPDHDVLQAHPTVSADILDRLGHGDLTVKPAIEALEGDRVRFRDGSVEPVDVIVYCTGYRLTFPFFDAGLVSAPGNDLPLYRRVFHPDLPTVFFIGLCQPLGAIMPIAEQQSKWVAAHLVGGYLLPSRHEMRADMDRERAAMRRRYVASPRHTMEVDFDAYLHDLRRERARGERRARRAGFPLPVPASITAPSRFVSVAS
jgi:dimethylaniline monooxygenase (N-oxide forming)